MIPEDLISLREAAKIFGVGIAVLHKAKHEGLFRVWPRDLGKHYASKADLQAWWDIHRAVKPLHIPNEKKCRGFEVLEEAKYNPKAPRQKFTLPK